MLRHFVQIGRIIAVLGVFVAVASSANLALAQYEFVRDSDNNDTWDNTGRWTDGNLNNTYPNAPDATVLIEAPTTTQPLVPMNVYTLTFPTDVTVGDFTIEHTTANAYRTNFNSGGGRLIFQSNSGPATYTETLGTINPTFTQATQYQFQLKVDLLSDLVITQDNYPNANTGTTFTQLVTGASNRTITKNGYGGIQFNYNPLPSETPFQGQYIINRGGIRMLTNGQISQSTGITVNAGGQLQLADNAGTENLTWNMASGAVLNLNGTGKALLGPNEVASPDGALRIAVVAAHPQTEFQNNVVLQTDSTINVATAGTTGTLSGTVTGAGGLTKSGAGSLVLSNGANGYQGDTVINGGTLSISSSFLSNASDVFLTTGSVFNLNFGGSDTIRSLFVDGTPQPIGTYGAADLGGLLITGGGTLTVTEVPVIGLDGDHNADGVVDAADYVAWRKDPDSFGGDPAGYNDWVANFGESQLGSGNGAPVPEPAVGVSILLATALCVMSRRYR